MKIGDEVGFPTSSERNGPNASGPIGLASGCVVARIRSHRGPAPQEGRRRPSVRPACAEDRGPAWSEIADRVTTPAQIAMIRNISPSRVATIRVNCLKFYLCATVLWHYECMSDERSFTLQCAPAPSTANSRVSFASWRGPALSPARGGAYCSSQARLITEPPTSTAKPRDKPVHDRRNTRMDVVGTGRAFGFGDVAAGAQTLTIWRAGEG